MRAKHLLIAMSVVSLTACGSQLGVPGVDLPTVGATVTGPATMQIGASVQLVATVSTFGSTLPLAPNAWAIRWKSSDPTSASVSDLGVLTAVSLGQVTITATPYQGKETGAPGTLRLTVLSCEPGAC